MGTIRPSAIARVGEAVNMAVERFVTVGETIADDYAEVRQGMYEACKEARQAGKNNCQLSPTLVEEGRFLTVTGNEILIQIFVTINPRCREFCNN